MASSVLAVRARQEAEVQRPDPRGGGVQHVEPVPLVRERADAGGELPRRGQDGAAVGPGQRRLADDDHRPLGLRQHGRERLRQGGYQPWRVAEPLRAVGQVRLRPDHADRQQATARRRLRMRAFSTGASRRGLLPMISSASASSMPVMALLKM